MSKTSPPRRAANAIRRVFDAAREIVDAEHEFLRAKGQKPKLSGNRRDEHPVQEVRHARA